MELFQLGKFKSHAGIDLPWKIECEALSLLDWKCIAEMILDCEMTSFRTVVGIPRGGIALANELQKHATGEPRHRTLVVDDVLTTGTSFREYLRKNSWGETDVLCWVVFAREGCPPWIKSLFQMPRIRRI